MIVVQMRVVIKHPHVIAQYGKGILGISGTAYLQRHSQKRKSHQQKEKVQRKGYSRLAELQDCDNEVIA